MATEPKLDRPLRSGWTTGACACAAAKAAYIGLITGDIPDTVGIMLPRGEQPTFDLKMQYSGIGYAVASVIKDAGDDPDVTHQAEIFASVTIGAPDTGITYRAGKGVGIVTKPGIPVPIGEPAINPGPRKIIQRNLMEIAEELNGPKDICITISIPNGEELTLKTMNPRIGIMGGVSILGTTGVVVPFSLEAWIQSVQRTIKVAAANGLTHIVGSTGNTSEIAAQKHYGLPEMALIEMGDFIGAMLKYILVHPIDRVTIAGGFAKLTKLAEGHLNVHSKESRVDFDALAKHMKSLGASDATITATRNANTAMEVLDLAQQEFIPIADHIASLCLNVCSEVVTSNTKIDILVTDREGNIIGNAR